MKMTNEILMSIKELSEFERERLLTELLSYREANKKIHLNVQKEISSRGIKKPCPYCNISLLIK
jgi:biotin synthase-like enzyme